LSNSLLAYFAELLLNLLAKSISIFLLSHPLIIFGDIELLPILLLLLGDCDSLVKELMTVSDEIRAITDQGTL
jgi:hypothetical protein